MSVRATSAVDEARAALCSRPTPNLEKRVARFEAAVRAETEEQRTGLVAGSQEAVADLTRRYPLTIAAVRAETLDVQRLEAIYDSYTWPPLTNISRPRHLAEYVRAALERLP